MRTTILKKQATAKDPSADVSNIKNFFEFKSFTDKDQLFDYIGSSAYGLDTHKAVCFGFQVHENSASDYEVELFFNGLPPREFMSIPDQKQDGADET